MIMTHPAQTVPFSIYALAERHATELKPNIAANALRILKKSKVDLANRWASYEADCEQDRKEGHRPHYCFHGMSQWTDYDNICGACEDGYGYSWESMVPLLYSDAIDKAKAFYKDMRTLADAARLLHSLNLDYDISDALDKLMERYGLA
jgi:hypothetical protein